MTPKEEENIETVPVVPEKSKASREKSSSSKVDAPVASESDSHNSIESKKDTPKKGEKKKADPLGSEKSSNVDFDANDFDESNILNDDTKKEEQ